MKTNWRLKGKERELYLDLSGRAGITQKGFEKLLKQLQFEDALQYVAIPAITIDWWDSIPGKRNDMNRGLSQAKSQELDGTGRKDLVHIFKKLREKGVKTVLKVIVDDVPDRPHTDEAIEQALERLNVEVWDWKRIDLSSEVIHKAAPAATDVHLYWSGNNAVLRGWSDETGLKCLKKLINLHLHVQEVCSLQSCLFRFFHPALGLCLTVFAKVLNFYVNREVWSRDGD